MKPCCERDEERGEGGGSAGVLRKQGTLDSRAWLHGRIDKAGEVTSGGMGEKGGGRGGRSGGEGNGWCESVKD